MPQQGTKHIDERCGWGVLFDGGSIKLFLSLFGSSGVWLHVYTTKPKKVRHVKMNKNGGKLSAQLYPSTCMLIPELVGKCVFCTERRQHHSGRERKKGKKQNLL